MEAIGPKEVHVYVNLSSGNINENNKAEIILKARTDTGLDAEGYTHIKLIRYINMS